MAVLQRALLMASAAALMSCITVNIYFPAAAVEKAADKIIEEVWQQKADKPQSQHQPVNAARRLALALLEGLVPPAAAQSADFNVSSPDIETIKAKMAKRFGQMSRYRASGAIGLTSDGLVAVRSLEGVAMNERAKVNGLVKAENEDRIKLYQAIAAANQHPEWAREIQSTFAGRWISQAQAGWYYQENGAWKQK